MVVSASSLVRVGTDWGDVKFAEPSGAAISSTLESIKHIEERIGMTTLNFAYSGSKQSKTATQASFEQAQSSATLEGLAEAITSSVESVLSLWAQWMGAPVDADGGTIKIETDAFSGQITPEMVSQFASFYTIGLLSRETVLKMLYEQGLLPSDIDIEKEIALTDLNPRLLVEADEDEQEDSDAVAA